jgi:hypothetical protein
MEFLNVNYHGRWLGRGGPMPWPLEYLTSRVYHNGKLEIWQQVVQAIYKAAVSIRNKLQHM